MVPRSLRSLAQQRPPARHRPPDSKRGKTLAGDPLPLRVPLPMIRAFCNTPQRETLIKSALPKLRGTLARMCDYGVGKRTKPHR